MSKYSSWIEVDLKKMYNNLSCIRSHARPGQKFLAMVKANAYGHGGKEVARFLANKVEGFGVANVNEALEIRNAGIENLILILGLGTPVEYALAIKHTVSVAVSSYQIAEELNDLAARQNERAHVHIKLDTGMGRLGLPYRDAFGIIRQIVKLPHLSIDGIFTHFSLADAPTYDFSDKQVDLFGLMIDELKKIGVTFKYVHVANSAGIMNNYQLEDCTMARPGITLYGYYGNTSQDPTVDVSPVLSLKSKVLFIKNIEQDKGVSYGRKYVAKTKTRIAVLTLGYSHGVSYALAGRIDALCNGKRYPVIGKICMDYCMVDLGANSDVTIGDDMIFIGSSGAETITAWDWANKTNTIPYEVLAGLNMGIPRIYVNG